MREPEIQGNSGDRRRMADDGGPSGHSGMWRRLCLASILVLILTSCLGQVGVQGQRREPPAEEKIPNKQLENWALSFGSLLWETARAATRFDSLRQKFHTEGASTKRVDGFSMVKKMAANIETMMQHKIDAIKRIMEFAENLALGHIYEKDLGHDLTEAPSKGGFHYYNAKKINVADEEREDDRNYRDRLFSATDREESDPRFKVGYSRINLEENKHYSGIPVNINMSSVHVPTNVFDGDPKVVNAIKWSRGLDRVFLDNYNRDPSLSWQYFGSSTGFMRQYPAMKWRMDEHDPDLYDARMRDWYIKSAASPKEIVILLDTSGSMTGLRKEIAKHVVLNILETLSEDDFVTVYSFSKEPIPLVDCFNIDGRAELVQATSENIREFQEKVNKVNTEEIANFTSALTAAFELLRDSREDPKVGANCNQAIMLVTDGVPYRFEELFKHYNNPHKPVRVFTYLIGREISDLAAANWMACYNKGYFTHVTTLAEVKEQVLKYVPVMARPMVMYRNEHPVRWTGVYADIEVPDPFPRPFWMIKLAKAMRTSEVFKTEGNQTEETEKRKNKFTGYRLMTSVSIPVFDQNNHTDPESLGLKKNPEAELLRKVRIAELLGVAGTDVPIRELEKLTPPEELGVNGYSFAVNNNGYVLYHPDLRPMFQEILKPNYNSVDLAEVELVDSLPSEPRGNDSELLEAEDVFETDVVGHRFYHTQIRKDMIDQEKGQNFLRVKQHFDFMKRATTRVQDYYYHGISNTPFSLGIALPRDYGRFRVTGQVEVFSAMFNISEKFAGDNWRVHPDWVYCEYNYAGEPAHEFDTPEEMLQHFVGRFKKPGWKWGTPRVRPLPQCSGNIYNPNCKKSQGMDTMDRNSHMCNKDLVQNLVFDAKVTDDFQNLKPLRIKGMRGGNPDEAEESGDAVEIDLTDEEITEINEINETYKRFGIRLAFVATRSGLLRFNDHSHLFPPIDEPLGEEHLREPHFADINNKATDETWYKRAVDYYKINPKAFVYSIPFDVGERKTTVTATHAIMVGKNNANQQAPAAVVGMQIDYEVFREMFFNETHTCSNSMVGKRCEKTCASEDLECYVVDNNGFVMISETPVHTGKFFGEVDGTIFESLIHHEIFDPIKIYDYQAICLETEDDDGSANTLLTPFKFVAWLFNYIIGQIAWTIIRFEIHHLWNPDWTYAFPQPQEPVPVLDNGEPDFYPQDTEEQYDNAYDYEDDMGDPYIDQFNVKDGAPIPLLQMTYINKTKPKPCDKEVTLYELNEARLYKNNRPWPVKGKLQNCHESECERPFSVTIIPHTNLILIVADRLCPCFSNKISIEPQKISYGASNETAYCDKLKYNIYRRKPTKCINYHSEENEIKLCGDANRSHVLSSWLLVCVLLAVNLINYRQSKVTL